MKSTFPLFQVIVYVFLVTDACNLVQPPHARENRVWGSSVGVATLDILAPLFAHQHAGADHPGLADSSMKETRAVTGRTTRNLAPDTG